MSVYLKKKNRARLSQIWKTERGEGGGLLYCHNIKGG